MDWKEDDVGAIHFYYSDKTLLVELGTQTFVDRLKAKARKQTDVRKEFSAKRVLGEKQPFNRDFLESTHSWTTPIFYDKNRRPAGLKVDLSPHPIDESLEKVLGKVGRGMDTKYHDSRTQFDYPVCLEDYIDKYFNTGKRLL